MKKKIFLACLVALMSTTPVYSYTGECKGGTIITANDGKTTFCRSNVQMNWWSAQAWCQVNGSRLATIYEMCPSWDGNTGSDKCPELKGPDGSDSKYRWSSTVNGNDKAFVLYPSNGLVDVNERKTTSFRYAFCL